MKKITVTRFNGYSPDCINPERPFIEITGNEDMDASDGYHTFTELYEHRIALFIALARMSARQEMDVGRNPNSPYVWRSRLHSDGSVLDGWYIMGIGYFKGHQLTYHLPEKTWDETNFAETLECAAEWDGHTSHDVIERLKKL